MRGPGAGLTRGRHSLLAPLRERSGQMAVELALLVPVIVAVALAVVNLMSFSELCARFDRVAPDAVLAHGASPSGSPEGLAGVEEVAEAIRRGMGTDACDRGEGRGCIRVRLRFRLDARPCRWDHQV